MNFDLNLFSSKLKRYRQQLDISIEDMSQSTGISIQNINALENGDKKPTGDEVLILADYYKCDYQFFLSNEKLAPFEQTETMFRRHSKDFSKKDRWAIQEFLFLCECEHFLLKQNPKFQYHTFSFTKTGNYYKGHAKEAAKKLRDHLGYSYNQIGNNIYDDFRCLGFHIFRRELGNSNISGLYIKHPIAGKCILVNYSEDVYRQRFTIAHECSHAILDEEEDFVVSLTYDQKNLVEVRANTFASHYLIPHELLNKIPDATTWNQDKAIQWANKLKVSTEALAYALKEAKLISDSTVQIIKSVKVPFEMKTDPELPKSLSPKSFERRRKLLKKGLSVFYVDLCFDTYEKGLISAGRLAEMLLVDEFELSELANTYGRSLKYGD